MSYDTGFSRRSGSERDLQSVAITSVDPVSRFAVGVTRTRHTVRINCAYATGDTITTPAVGEQWYCERFGGEWRLYGRIPFNDPTLNIEPEEGQVLVGSASGPLELNGTEVRSNGTVFRLNGIYYRDDGETLQRSTDKEVWEPISGTAAGAIQLIGNALSGIPVTEDVAGFLERLGDEETETLQALAEWAQGLGDEIGNAWNVACDNPFFTSLRELGSGDRPIDQVVTGFQAFINDLWGTLFCGFTGNLTPQTALTGLGGISGLLAANPLVQGLADLIGDSAVGNLAVDAISGATEFLQQLVDLLLCNFTGELTPQGILDAIGEVLTPLTESPFIQGLSSLADTLGTGVGNLFQDAIAGATGLVQAVFGAIFCDFSGDFTPQAMIAKLTEVLTSVTENPFVAGLISFAEGLGHTVGGGIEKAFAGANELLEALFGVFFCDNEGVPTPQVILDSVSGVVDYIRTNPLVAGLVEFIEGVGTTSTGFLQKALEGAFEFFNQIVNTIFCNLPGQPKPADIMASLVAVIVSVTDNPYVAMLRKVAEFAGDTSTNLIQQLMAGITGIFDWFVDLLNTLIPFFDWNQIKTLDFPAMMSGLLDGLNPLVTINDVVDWVEQATGVDFSNGPAAFVTSLFTALQNSIAEVFTTISGVLTWIEEQTGLDFTDPVLFLSSLVTKLVGDVNGFVAGISGALWNLTEFVNDLWAGMNQATGLTWHTGPIDFLNSLVQKILADLGINLSNPEALFGSLQGALVTWIESVTGVDFSNGPAAFVTSLFTALQDSIAEVFTTISSVTTWIEGETGLTFSEGPGVFIQSVINNFLTSFELDFNGPYELWTSIVSPLEEILGLNEGGFTNFLGNLTVFFNGLPNFFDGPFNLQSAVQFFLTDTLGIAQIGAAGLQFVESLIPDVLGTLNDFFDNIASFLGLDLRLIASDNFIPGLAFVTFLTNIKDVLMEWIRFYVFGGVQSIGEWVEDSIFNPIAQTFLGGLKLPPALLGVTEIAEAGLGVLGDIAGTLLTSLTAIPATLLEGILPPGLLGQIPVSNISDTSPNLINLGAFAEAGNIEASDDWSWDANNNFPGSSGGSAKLVISTAGNRHLYSRQAVPVGGGDRLVLSARVMSSGLTVNPSGSTPIYISLIPFIGTSQQSAIPVGTARGATTSWNSIGNTADDPYVVTNADWTSVIVRLTVASTATAGTVWWDEVSLTKTGKLVQDNVDSLIDAWNSMIGGLEGLGENVSGFDWTRLFTAAANARQQGTVAQERLNNTNTNLFGTPLGGTTFAPETLPTLISNLAAIKVDGNETMSGFLDGLLDAFGGQLPPGTAASVAEVVNSAASVTNTAEVANTAAGTANTNLQVTWNDLFDAFNGSSGSTGKTSANARDRGAAVRNSAVTGEANASTALTNAATADGKAVEAQDLGYQLGNRGANLLPNGSFENSNFYIGASANRGYSSEEKRSGAQSLRCRGYMWTPLFADRNTFYLKSPCAAGDKIYHEIYVRGAVGNVASTRTCFIQTSFFDQNGNYISNSIQYPASVNAGTGLNGVWTKLSGIATAPANAASHDFTIVQLSSTVSGTEANNVYYWDDAKCYRITEAFEAQLDADLGIANAATAQATANTGVTNAATAQTAADAAQADVDAATELLNAAVTSGANLIPDPSFENPNLDAARKATSGSVANWWTFVTDVVKTGSRAAEITLYGIPTYPSLNLVPSLKPAWSTDPNIRVPCRPGQVFYLSQWVYLRSPNTGSREVNLYLATFNAAGTIQYMRVQAFPALETWTKIEGYFKVTRSDVVSVVPQFGAFRPSNALNSKAVFDDVVMVDVTDAYYAQQEADAARADANTGIANAAIAKTQADLGVTNAAAADSKAVAAGAVAGAALTTGFNLIPNSSFEDTSIYIGNTGAWYSTDVARTGTRSLRIAGVGNSPHVYLFGTATAAYHLPCKPGDVFRYSYWVYGKSDNNETHANALRFGINVMNAAGANIAYNVHDQGASPALNSVWTQMTGTITITTNAAASQFKPYIQRINLQDETFYIDDVVLERITESNAAKVAADAAQLDADAAQADANTGIANASTAQKDISNIALSSNLIPDPTFIDPNIQRYGYSSVVPTYTTEESYVGGRCLTWTSAGSTWQGPYFSALQSSKQRFRCSPGDTFNIRLKIKYKSTNNMSAGYVRIFIRFWQSANGGTYTDRVAGTYQRSNASFGGTGWLDMNCWGVCPDDRSAVEIFIINDPSTPNGNVYYIDAVRMEQTGPAQEITDTVTQAIAGGSTTGNSLATLKLKVTETKTQADLGVANAGTAQSTTEEVKLALYGSATAAPSTAIQTTAVPALPQSKIANLTTDLAAKLTSSSALNASNLTSGTLPAARVAAGSLGQDKVANLTTDLSTNATNIGNTIDGIVNGFRGWTGSWTTTETAEVAAEISSAVSALNQSVAALESQEAAGTFSGNSAVEDFSTYTGGSTLGAAWSQTYSGTGTGLSLGVYSGQAKWTSSGGITGQTRKCLSRYVTEQSDTDYQKIGFVAGSTPGAVSSAIGYSYILGRMNSAGTQYVYAKFRNSTAYIGYNAGAGEVNLSSVAHTFVAGSTYWLIVGTGEASQRTFQILRNGAPVLTVTDSGAASIMGASNRFVGFGGEGGYAAGGVYAVPAAAASFAFYDNVPPTYRGSGFRASRKTTTASGVSTNTTTTFADSWYTTDYITDDMSYNATTNVLTVNTDGWYQVTITQGSNNGSIGFGVGGNFGVALFKNGSVVAKSGGWSCNINVGFPNLSGTFTVYCEAGDTLEPGYYQNGTVTGNYFNGDAAGVSTWWTVSFISNKMPTN